MVMTTIIVIMMVGGGFFLWILTTEMDIVYMQLIIIGVLIFLHLK